MVCWCVGDHACVCTRSLRPPARVKKGSVSSPSMPSPPSQCWSKQLFCSLLSSVPLQVPLSSLSAHSSSTPCTGEVITLVCQHPLLATNATRYSSSNPVWRENGSTIRIAIGTRYQATTAADFMSTTLTFTISADYFSGRTFYYDCFLHLSAGELDTSGNSTVAVPELSSLALTFITSLEFSINVEWLAANCARSYNISWECTLPISSSAGSTSTANTNITVPVDSNSECTLSLVAVYGDGSTGPNITTVVHSGYPRPTDNRCTSTSQDLILTCQFGGGEYTDIQWNSSSGPINSSDDQLTLNYTTLRDGTEFSCSGVEMGRMHRVRGDNYFYNESLSCEPTSAPPTPTPAGAAAGDVVGAVIAAVVVVVVAVAVIVVVVVVGVRRRSSYKVDTGDPNDTVSLTILMVVQALNSVRVDIISVRGFCASLRCREAGCLSGVMSSSDLFCLYRQKRVALHILSSQKDQRIHNLETIRNQLSTADHCFALWPGKSVPKRIREEVSRAIVPEQNEGKSVTVLALPGLPWRAECQERKTFIQQVLAVLDPQLEPLTVAMEVAEGSVTVLPSQPSQPARVPRVDILQLVYNLFMPRSSPSATPVIPYVEAPGVPIAVNYTKPEVLEALCTVLSGILGVKIQSVQGTCWRRSCVAKSGVGCRHCYSFQPDIEARFRSTKFVIKCMLRCFDGEVTHYHTTRINDTRLFKGLPLGILLYDVVGIITLPETENCTKFAIGRYPGFVTPWIKRVLVVISASLKAAATTPTVPANDTTYAVLEDCSDVGTIRAALGPPSASEEKKEKVDKDECSQHQSSLEQKEEGEISVVPPRLEEGHGELMAIPLKPKDRPPLPPPPDVAVTTSPKQPAGSSLSELDPPSASEEKNEKVDEDECSQSQSSSEEEEVPEVPPRNLQEHAELMAIPSPAVLPPPPPPPVDVVVTIAGPTQPIEGHGNG